jgi:putative CocE/NonD family hydrolase
MTAADLYHGWFYHHGALRLSSSLAWGIQMLREDARRKGLRAASDRLEAAWANVRAQAMQAPYADHAALTDPELPGYVRDWFSHREAGEYWTSQDISTRLDRIRVPALHLTGWYDMYLEGSIACYTALRAKAGSEFARMNQYLIAGPWVHIPWGDRVGEANLGDAANADTDLILLCWLDHWLKDSGDFKDEPRIRYFALGPNEWREAERWPAKAEYALYLRSAGNANSRKGDGFLSTLAAKGEEPHDVFVYDPEVPVMAPGGALALSGPYDQAAMELGNNLLVYTSEPVTYATEVFGHARVRLFAATSADHADFTAKVVRMTANGRAEFLAIGVARSSWLFGEQGYALAAGERLRLEIAGSAFPLYDRNPSTATPPQLADNWNWVRSTQQVLHSAEHPSALFLPVKGEPGW